MEMNEIIEILRKDRDSDKVDWDYISAYQKLSEEFIKEFKDEVNWDYISAYQKLSEEFIREFKDEVNWYDISIHQKLSEEFIREHSDNVDWDYISMYQKLSEEFIKEFKDKIYLECMKDNWLYTSDEYKKDQLINTNSYECYDDYFIAYKAIRSDNYSLYNFMYKYELNGIYESNADYTSEENSFGLSVWTKEEAIEYGNDTNIPYKIIKVKVYYKDISRIVHDNNKIRCTRLEVISEE